LASSGIIPARRFSAMRRSWKRLGERLPWTFYGREVYHPRSVNDLERTGHGMPLGIVRTKPDQPTGRQVQDDRQRVTGSGQVRDCPHVVGRSDVGVLLLLHRRALSRAFDHAPGHAAIVMKRVFVDVSGGGAVVEAIEQRLSAK